MKVQVPGDDIIESEFQDFVENAGPKKIGVREAFERGVTSGIAQANEQLASAPPTKRPFLNDSDITIQANSAEPTMLGSNGFYNGARWARDKYEARDANDVPNVEPKWQPVVGDKCAFWDQGDSVVSVGIFEPSYTVDFPYFNATAGEHTKYCALLESIDEIGKPPSYFQERGRCTV